MSKPAVSPTVEEDLKPHFAGQILSLFYWHRWTLIGLALIIHTILLAISSGFVTLLVLASLDIALLVLFFWARYRVTHYYYAFYRKNGYSM